VARRTFCTLFDKRFLPRGLVLYRSIARCCEEFELFVFCMDATTQATLDALALPGLSTIPLDEIEAFDPALADVKSTRNWFEYYWTMSPIKPLFLFHRIPGLEHVITVDPDVELYADPQPLFDDLGDGSIFLTKHRSSLRTVPTTVADARWGVFNIQFEIFRRDDRAIAALQWWRERCLEWCYDRFEHGRYGDQKYVEEFPARFEGVRTTDRPGAGTAPWNSRRHRIELRDKTFVVDESPLLYHHFAGLDLHEATFAGRLLARMGGAYRLTAGAVPLVWSTPDNVPEDHRNVLWDPYVGRLGHALADVRAVAGDVVPMSSLRTKRVALRIGERHPLPWAGLNRKLRARLSA